MKTNTSHRCVVPQILVYLQGDSGTPKQKQTTSYLYREYFWTKKSSRLRYSNNSIEKLS